MKKLRSISSSVCCMALLAAGGKANTVWNATGASPVNWNDAANWTSGVPVSVATGQTTARFNLSDRAECVVTGPHSYDQLLQGVDGPGGVIRIQNGGSLSSGGAWTGIGYNSPARMIVETGGVLNCGDHLWIGFYSPAVGTLDINGGTVNLTMGQLGLGWETGTGFVNITNFGVLNVSYLDPTRAISSTSVLDIEEGMLVINGNHGTTVENYISAGRITGYGGSGTPVWDVNITNPGKTTVKAIPGQITPNWQVKTTIHPTDDWVVAPFDAATDFGIIADGVTDMTDEIQNALVVIGNLGGGSLYLPAGQYKVAGNLNIPSGVTLRGDWRKPGPSQPVTGTVLMAYAGRDNENAAPFITLNNSGGMNGLSIWYPEQTPTDIRPYPPSIGNGGAVTVENVTFVNSYWGFTSYVDGITSKPFLRNLYGTPLKLGIEFDCLADIGRIETVHFSPNYWAQSGLPGAPTVGGPHAAWMHANGTGVVLRRIDWSYSCYVTVEGYSIGLALRPGRFEPNIQPNGQSYGFNLLGCKTGIFIEESAYAGYQFTRFRIEDTETGIHFAPTATEPTMFHSCVIKATDNALFCEGVRARVLMMACDFQKGALRMDYGHLSVSHSDFASGQPLHIELGENARGASILGNRFPNGARIIDRTLYPVRIDHAPLAADPLPAYDFKKPATPRRSAKSDLFVVTKAPFNAVANGVSDDTAAFQAALTAAGANGGGTVFVPGGNYRLNGNLTVPTGVELRGVSDTPKDTGVKGSLLNVYAGRNQANGTPFIQLAAGAGVRGLSFHYPEQIYNAADTVNFGMVPYPFLIRGMGADVHVINISATIPYQLLDLATNRCDRHYVDYVFSTALKTGFHVGGGSVDGQLHNCQLNPGAYAFVGGVYPSIPQNGFGIYDIIARDATPYLFGNVTGQILHQNFVFGGARGLHLVKEGAFGPSGHCLGMGLDQCTVAMQIDGIGSGDLQPINSQIVTVNPTVGRYLETGASFNGIFKMFGCAGWGLPQYSVVISGGDVRLQLFHIHQAGTSGQFWVRNSARLDNIGGNLGANSVIPFLTIDSTAQASFKGNIINTPSSQMPVNSVNVTALGNLRVEDPTSGANTSWNNGAGNQQWSMASNWNGGLANGTSATIISGTPVNGPLIATGINAAAKSLVVGDQTNTSGRLDVTGGALSISNWLVLGYDTGNTGTLALDSGEVGITGDLFVGLRGAGNLQITGGALGVLGTLAVAAEPGSSGTVSLSAGILGAGNLDLSAGGVVDLKGGTLVLSGDVTAQVNALANEGRIVGFGGPGSVVVAYNTPAQPGRTTVTGSPPPLTTTQWRAGSPGTWTTNVDWTGENAPLELSQNLKVVFNLTNTSPCTLAVPATVGLLVMGDNNPPTDLRLILEAGANLTAGIDSYGRKQWTGIGYNSSAAMTVGTGAVLHCRDHLWIGLFSPAVGTLDINGGTVEVDGQFGLGWDTGTGTVTIRNGGTLLLGYIDPMQSIGATSSIDIQSGTIVLKGNGTSAINGYVASGKITSFGGAGTLNVAHNGVTNLTTVSSIMPLNFASVFTNNMVLQRDQNVAVYGTAAPGTQVTLSFAEQTKNVTTAQNGKWMAVLDPMPASFTNRTLTVASSSGSKSINNVLVGDVWFASGQSNMHHSFSSYSQLTTAGKDNLNIRLLMGAQVASKTPQETAVLHPDHALSWQECSAAYLNSFSPVAYFYGSKLQTDLNIPIGLILSAWGGTRAEAWTPASKLLELGYPVVDPGTIDANDQSVLYNGMIHPFRNFTFKGVIWYQGESNSNCALEYQALFSGMIESWRTAFGRGNIPFYFVQIAPWGTNDPDLEGQSWAWLRDSQTRTLSVPNTGMAVTTDLGEYGDIHPQSKQLVGERLALHALKAEGASVVASSPIYSGMTKSGNQITVSFANVNNGLKTQEVRMNKNANFPPGTDPQAYVVPASSVAGFKICGGNRIFVDANAVITGNQVIVSSPSVPNPIAVRYAWENFPLCNLYSMSGLPVSPFRTDSFDPRSIGDLYSGNSNDYGQLGIVGPTNDESSVTPNTIAGVSGNLIDVNPPSYTRYGYFRSQNEALRNGTTPYQIVQVLYYDQGNSTFSMVYDATSGPWKNSPLTVNMTNSLQWRVATAYISDAHFGGRCNGYDVRLHLGAPTTIGGVFFSAIQGGSNYYNWADANNLLKERQDEDMEQDGYTNYQEFLSGTDPYLSEFDSWKNLNGVTENLGDDDADGVSNLLEFALDGNPKISDSAGRLPQLLKNASGMEFVFRRSQSTVTYRVEKTTNLVDWNNFVTVTDIHGNVKNMATVVIPSPGIGSEKLFFRLNIEHR